MHLPRYNLKSESSLTSFDFISEGPKGIIRKRVEFQETADSSLYNLAFGDKHLETGVIDDLSISNNGDTEKILATVVAAVYAFFEAHRSAYVYASGSTKARTRLYRMGITKYFSLLKRDFYLYGEEDNNFREFEVGKSYDGFLAQRKFA